MSNLLKFLNPAKARILQALTLAGLRQSSRFVLVVSRGVRRRKSTRIAYSKRDENGKPLPAIKAFSSKNYFGPQRVRGF